MFVKSYEITAEGKRQDLFLSSAKELRLTFSGSTIDIELTFTDEFAERLWFRMFASP